VEQTLGQFIFYIYMQFSSSVMWKMKVKVGKAGYSMQCRENLGRCTCCSLITTPCWFQCGMAQTCGATKRHPVIISDYCQCKSIHTLRLRHARFRSRSLTAWGRSLWWSTWISTQELCCSSNSATRSMLTVMSESSAHVPSSMCFVHQEMKNCTSWKRRVWTFHTVLLLV